MQKNIQPNAVSSTGSQRAFYNSQFFWGLVGILIGAMLLYVLLKPLYKKLSYNTFAPTADKVSSTPVLITWIIYTSPQYGYSVSYPSTWTLQKLGKNAQTLDAIIFNPPSGSAKAITITVSTKNSQNSIQGKNPVDAERVITVDSVNISEQVEHDSAGNQTLVAVVPLSDTVITVKANSNDGALFDHMVSSLQFKK